MSGRRLRSWAFDVAYIKGIGADYVFLTDDFKNRFVSDRPDVV
jgi:hypothetical protein